MKQGDATRLLLAVCLQRPMEGAVVIVQPSPPFFSPYGPEQRGLQEGTANDTLASVPQGLQATLVAADLAQDKKAQVEALHRVWDVVFPDTTWKLTKNSALELLKITNGSAEKVFLYLQELQGREGIQWPFAYSKALLQKKMREEAQAPAQQADDEIPDGIRQALELGAKQGDGYTDFRKHLKSATQGNEGG